MDIHTIILDVANISLALTFVAGLIIGLAQVKLAARDRKEKLTLEALRNFQTYEFAELMHFVMSDKMPKTREELNALPERERIMFTQYAQQMEALGIQVAQRLIDMELVDKTLGSFVTLTWKRYANVYLTMRDRDPFVAEYFQWMAERMDEKLKNNPREPFYKTPDFE
jgi:hypothetical protein